MLIKYASIASTIFNNNNLVKFLSLFVFAIPPFLITGPAIPDILLSCIAFYFLVCSLRFNLWSKYYKNYFVYIFILFYLYVILRSIFSEDPFYSLTQSGLIFYFRYLFFSLGVWYLIDNNKNLIKYLILSLSICSIFVMVDGFFQFFTGFNLLGWPLPTQDRLSGLFKNEMIIGSYISKISPMIIGLSIYNFYNKKLNFLLNFILLLISIIFVFVSGERMAFLHIMIFTFLIIFLTTNLSNKFKITFVIFMIISVFLASFSIPVQKRINDTMRDVKSTSLPFLPYTIIHESHYTTAFKMFRDEPFFGKGPSMFRKLCSLEKYKTPYTNNVDGVYHKDACTTHPHNFYIQHLAEIGLVGFFFLFICFFHLTRIFIKQFIYILKQKIDLLYPNYYIITLSIIYFMIWPIIPTVNFYNNWFGVFLYLTIGFALKSNSLLKIK